MYYYYNWVPGLPLSCGRCSPPALSLIDAPYYAPLLLTCTFLHCVLFTCSQNRRALLCNASSLMGWLVGGTFLLFSLVCRNISFLWIFVLVQVHCFWQFANVAPVKMYRGRWNGWWVKTNKDTDWRFQAALNPQVLLPLMAQRGIEVGWGRQFSSENLNPNIGKDLRRLKCVCVV